MKSVLDYQSLEHSGITFSRRVMEPKQLGNLLGYEAEVLAKRLTDFRKFAPQNEAKHEKLRREQKKLGSRAIEAHKRARSTIAATEERWMELVKTKIVDEILERARSEGAKALGLRDLMRYFRGEGDEKRTASRGVLLETTPADAPRLKSPKPDLYFSFSIIEQDKVPRGDEEDEEGEERKWDEVYIPSESEQESTGLDSDDEDYFEYELDKRRVDSLMQELMKGLSVGDSPKSGVKGSSRFIKACNELGCDLWW
ncbi:hypothetical protein BDW75DRAFT_242235 [Aspergillus navahoensis]